MDVCCESCVLLGRSLGVWLVTRPQKSYQVSCLQVGSYRGADKSLARPWKKTSYSDQDLQHYIKTCGVQTTGIYFRRLYAISLRIVL